MYLSAGITDEDRKGLTPFEQESLAFQERLMAATEHAAFWARTAGLFTVAFTLGAWFYEERKKR